MEVKDRIRNRRKELGLTLEEVGNIVGVSKSTVRKWETGFIENMKRDKIALLAKALRTSPTFIMGLDGEDGEVPIDGMVVYTGGKRYDIGELPEEGRQELTNVLDYLFNKYTK